MKKKNRFKVYPSTFYKYCIYVYFIYIYLYASIQKSRYVGQWTIIRLKSLPPFLYLPLLDGNSDYEAHMYNKKDWFDICKTFLYIDSAAVENLKYLFI